MVIECYIKCDIYIYIWSYMWLYMAIPPPKKNREVENLEMIGMLDVLFTFWKHDSIYLGIHESEL